MAALCANLEEAAAAEEPEEAGRLIERLRTEFGAVHLALESELIRG